MTKFLLRALPIVGLVVDALLIADIASDHVKKYQDRKNNKSKFPAAETARAAEA